MNSMASMAIGIHKAAVAHAVSKLMAFDHLDRTRLGQAGELRDTQDGQKALQTVSASSEL